MIVPAQLNTHEWEKLLPEWCNFVAKDFSGMWYAYESEPYLEQGLWWHQPGTRMAPVHCVELETLRHWKDSKVQKPEPQVPRILYSRTNNLGGHRHI